MFDLIKGKIRAISLILKADLVVITHDHKWNADTINVRNSRQPKCFIPEKYNPYPLCIGRDMKKCKDCQIRAEWDLKEGGM